MTSRGSLRPCRPTNGRVTPKCVRQKPFAEGPGPKAPYVVQAPAARSDHRPAVPSGWPRRAPSGPLLAECSATIGPPTPRGVARPSPSGRPRCPHRGHSSRSRSAVPIRVGRAAPHRGHSSRSVRPSLAGWPLLAELTGRAFRVGRSSRGFGRAFRVGRSSRSFGRAFRVGRSSRSRFDRPLRVGLPLRRGGRPSVELRLCLLPEVRFTRLSGRGCSAAGCGGRSAIAFS